MPHQLRHAGPSFDYAERLLDLPSIQLRGRWLTEASVRRYQKSGRLNEQVQELPLATRRYCEESFANIKGITLGCLPASLPP